MFLQATVVYPGSSEESWTMYQMISEILHDWNSQATFGVVLYKLGLWHEDSSVCYLPHFKSSTYYTQQW